MSEFGVEGPELKKMIKLARKGPMPFAFNPGSNNDEHLFAMHRIKQPKTIAKATKADGVGNKVAFGTCQLTGKILSLTCEREVPAMARKLKKYLKSEKVAVNIQILDANGNLLEEDIEELPYDPELDEEDDAADAPPPPPAAADAPEAPPPPPPAGSAPEVPPPPPPPPEAAAAPAAVPAAAEPEAAAAEPDVNAIAAQLKALAPRIKAAPPAAVEKLAPAFKTAVELVKAQELDKAAALIQKLEAALDGLEAQAAPAAAPGTEDTPREPAAAAVPDARELATRLKAIQAQLGGLPDAVAQQLMKAIKSVVDVIKAGDTARAAQAVDKIEAKLTELLAAQSPEPAPAAEAAAEPAAETAPAPPPAEPAGEEGGDRAALLKEFDRLTPLEARASSSGMIENLTRFKYFWNQLIDGKDTGPLDQAWEHVAKIKEMIRAGEEMGTSTHGQDISPEVQPIATSRLNWVDARGKMNAEMDKLKAAILSVCSGDEELQEVADNVNSLFDYIKALDVRLEDKLDQVVNSEAGGARDKLKDEARKLLTEYQSELQAPFFADVDAGNGFANVAITSTATDALKKIESVLAA
jgi:hypothetical protein